MTHWVTQDAIVTMEDLEKFLQPLAEDLRVRIRIWEVLAAQRVPGKWRWAALPERVFYFTIHPKSDYAPKSAPGQICKQVSSQLRERFGITEDQPA